MGTTTALPPAIPAAPSHLPEKAAKQWQATYVKALAAAKLASPDNERAQRIAALKAANQMLAVPAPQSAADIDNLEDWQVIKRATINGVARCVTADGRKYEFVVDSTPAKK